MDYRLGRLRFCINILAPHPDSVDSATGEAVKDWTMIAAGVPAGYDETAKDTDHGDKPTVTIDGVFTIRWMRGVTSLCRIEHDGQLYEVKAKPKDPDGRRRWLVIPAALLETH